MKNLNITKRVLLLLFMIIGGGSLKAQVEFAPVGAEWYYERLYMNYETWSYEGVTYDRFRSLDIVEINGWQCKEIELFQNIDCNGDVNPYYETRYINQDGDKIYEVIDEERYLLYDFSKQVGEYWIVTHYDQYDDAADTIYVEDIKELTLEDGTTRRIFVTSSTEGIIYCNNIIEGIGLDKSLFPYYDLVGPPPCKHEEIRCYYENENLLISHDKECDYEITYESMLSINEEKNQTVFLNTIVKDRIDILFNETAHNVSGNINIYDMMGKLIYRTGYYDSSVSIDCGGFTSGMYFIRIDSDNNSQTFKIIKL